VARRFLARSFASLLVRRRHVDFSDECLFSPEKSGHFFRRPAFSHRASPLDLPAPVFPLLCFGPGSRQASAAAS